MRSIRFWKTEVQHLSLMERMFFKDVIKTLLSWEVLKKEYRELDLIRRVLESEIQINTLGRNADTKKCYEDD